MKLKRLLDSIPIRENLEVLVVDDRSNEDLEILDQIKEEFKTYNIAFFQNNRIHKGAGTCRNIGLEHAQGQWLLFADADDYFMEGLFDKVKLYFTSNNDVVFFSPTSWDEVANKISHRHIGYRDLVINYLKDKANPYNQLNLRYRFVVPWSKLINAKFIKNKSIKFDEVIASNDEMFSTKVGFYAKKIGVSKEVIYCVTKDKGTLTQDLNNDIHFTRLNVYISKMLFLRENLERKEFKLLNINGRGPLINTVKYNLGFRAFFITLFKLRKVKMKLLDFRFINPFFIISKVSFHIKTKKRDLIYKKNFRNKN